MPTFFSAKMQKPQLAGVIALLGMAAVFINMAIAITFTPKKQPTGYVGQDEMSNFNLTSGSETLYRPEYERDKWSGNLYAYPIDAAGNLHLAGERWMGGARGKIDEQHYDAGRNIATMDDNGSGVSFRSGKLGATQEPSLAAKVHGADYTSAQIINFLRGDRSNEGSGKLRERRSVLGDIVHARPYYMAEADGTDPTIFVGANDGMLHAINADDGTERWAYIPSMLIGKLKTLAYSPTEAAQPFAHDYFVDGQVNIANILIGVDTHRVLVGGLGGGGRGLYALKITSLTAADESKVIDKKLWEITPGLLDNHKDHSPNKYVYTNLGYTYGAPVIDKVRDGSNIRDAIIVGNGYNDGDGGCDPVFKSAGGTNEIFDSGADLATKISDCQAYLYVIRASNGKRIMAIKAGDSGTAASPNGLSSPAAVDSNGDDVIDRIYAGDLNGTMWKFDLSDTDPGNWKATPLYVTDPKQPITGTPGVAVHPNGGYMVNFGTGAIFTGEYGKYNHGSTTPPVSSPGWTTSPTGDLGSTSVHYVYGIRDHADATVTPVEQTLEERSYTDPAGQTTRVRRSTAYPVLKTGKGWKVALPAGERIVGEGSFIENGRFYFNSYNPTVAPHRVPGTDTDIYGENWLMELNYLTGGSSDQPFLDMDGNLLLNDNDRITYTKDDPEPKSDPKLRIGDPIRSPNEKGIPVGKWISNGVQSQPVLVQLRTLNTTLFNQNPDVIYPPATPTERGVIGGHFDATFYYGANNNCTYVAGSGTYATGYVNFKYTGSKDLSSFSIKVGGVELLTDNNPDSFNATYLESWVSGTPPPGLTTATWLYPAHYNGLLGYTLKSGGAVDNSIQIKANEQGAAYNKTITVSLTGLVAADMPTISSVPSGDPTFPGIPGVAGGTDPTPESLKSAAAGSTTPKDTICREKVHDHEYDDIYDKSGLNMLNASDTAFNLSNAIPNPATKFKVLLMNQYLSPAASIHIGKSGYHYASSTGYVSVKDYQTAAGLDITAVPAYTLDPGAPDYIKSLVINMPVDAFSVKDWWGNTDERVGLHPTDPEFVRKSVNGAGADMYQPVIYTGNAGNIVDVPGTTGGVSPDFLGVRHNGALTVQIIKDTTPASAIEQSVADHPEYGYRVKRANFYNYVLAEYTIFFHHPNGMHFNSPATDTWKTTVKDADGNNVAWNSAALMTGSGFSKHPPLSTAPASQKPLTPAAGSTDPKWDKTIESAESSTTGKTTTTVITYVDKTTLTEVRTENDDGTVTIVKTWRDKYGKVEKTETETIASAAGSVKSGGDESGLQARTGRVSWHELVR